MVWLLAVLFGAALGVAVGWLAGLLPGFPVLQSALAAPASALAATAVTTVLWFRMEKPGVWVGVGAELLRFLPIAALSGASAHIALGTLFEPDSSFAAQAPLFVGVAGGVYGAVSVARVRRAIHGLREGPYEEIVGRPTPRTAAELDAGLPHVVTAPRGEGTLEMIVCRPGIGARETLDRADLDPVAGLVGDTWQSRGSSRTSDGLSHPDMQLTIMSARAADLVAGDRIYWPLAGDQLFVDLDLGADNMPPGTRLAVGSALLEITPEPHTGCGKFVERFGLAAMKLVNSPAGRRLNLRGVNARVVQGGEVKLGDFVRKTAAAPSGPGAPVSG
jgi:hypothetical protein